MISRRAFISSGLCGVGVALAAAHVIPSTLLDEQTGAIALERVRAPIRGLPSAFEGYKIGFLTDIHLGMWLPNEWVIRALELLAGDRIDLLVLGGDYIFINDNPLWRAAGIIRNTALAEQTARKAIPLIYSELSSILSKFPFPDGSLGVPGNHDHWNSTAIFLSILGSSPGLELLINRERIIKRNEQTLRIFGVDDFLTGIPTLPPQLNPPQEGETRIIVSHNPDYISALTTLHPNYHFDLALCGHTHGGQIRLPYLGAVMRMIRDPRFIAGLVQLEEKLVYTSRGLGVVGLPVRIGCPPEVTVITLSKA